MEGSRLRLVERVFSMRKSDVRSERGQSSGERPRGKEPERRRKCEPESVPKKRLNGGVVQLGEAVQERLTRRSDAESRRKNGEFVPWRPGKSEPNSGRWGKLEVEKKEKCDGWGKWQVEKKVDEIDKSHYSGSERSRKSELGKCELVPESNSSYLNKVEVERRGRDGEKSEFHGSGRSQRMELEEEGFIPENSCRKKDGDQGSGIDNRKRPSLSSSLNCDPKESSRAHEEEQDEFKHEASSGKVQDKDHFFERLAKRQCGEPESNGRKYHHQEISDISQLKSRRKTEENIPSPASYPERPNRNQPKLPSKVSSSNKHPSSRHHEPFLSPLGPDNQDQRDHKDRTPSNYDRSPVERVRHHYNRDHTIHRDRTLSRSDRSAAEKVRNYDNRDHRDHRDRTPSHSDQSTSERVRHHDNRDHYDHRDRTPSLSDRSPMGRARRHDRKGHSVYMNRIPSHSHRSPMGRALHHRHRDHPDHRYHSPCPLERARHHDHVERSPHDRRRALVHRIRTPNGCGRGLDSRERNKKSGEGGQQRVDRHEERPGQRVSSGRDGSKISSLRRRNNRGGDTCFDVKPSKKPVSPNSVKEFGELSSPPPPPPPPPRPLPSSLIPPQLETYNVLDELPCMEEDMDICDTPPHDTVDSKPGKWFYLDHFGMEQGQSKLGDLKRLINTGVLSDHLIKHSNSDRWVTVENAASPLVQLNLPSIVSDYVAKLASPPEAQGKSLVDTADLSLDSSTLVLQEELELGDEPAALEFSQEFLIDERVEGLLKGYNLVNGKELETLREALNMTFEHADWENWSCSEGFTRYQSRNFEPLSCHRQELRSHEGFPREAIESRPVAHLEKDFAIPNTSSRDWFSARWPCMGGDWKRNDESGQDRFSKKKIVLNHGYPLCQMPKSDYEDPRWQQRDEMYYPSRIRKLEVPAWAFSFSEESDINNDTGKVTILRQMKPPVPKGVKGTILPVVQTNACVVKDQGSSLTRLRFKGSERHTRRSTRSHRSHSACGDRCSDSEEPSSSKKTRELDLQRLQRCRTSLNIPRDHVCTVDELSLDLGDWYYMDGAGQVHGQSSFSELQDVVAKGTITQNSSVFRKDDNTWFPILAPKASSSVKERDDPPVESSSTFNDLKSASDSFHDLHPQFIGYTRGKLHELVMKSYKNREFAAAINEVLDPWITAKQQKKEMGKHFSINSSTTKREDAIPEMFRDGSQFGKSACLLTDGDSEMKEDLHLGPKNDPSFDDLCSEADFIDDNIRSSGPENENWGLLNVCILARVFHFMKTDLKSLISSAATCKSWNLAVNVYKNLCTFVDMSSLGPRCTDSMFRSALGGYEKKKLTSIVLAGCSNITSAVLEEVLSLFPCVSIIDIRGCSQFKDLVFKFQNIKWIKSSSNSKSCEESYSKIKNLKQLTMKGYSTSKAFRDFGGHVDDFEGSGDLVRNEYNLVDRKDSSNHPFRQGVYKRAKLFDARKSAAVLSRDAQKRRWLHRKSENGNKKMEQFIGFNLKDIMKENRFEFFIPKVAKIEDRMRSGYYVRRGLASLKDDISRMCRDAFKAKNRGDAKDMKHIIMSFIRLAKSLEGNPRLLSYEKDDMLKTVKDAPEYSSTPRCIKKQIKVASEKDTNGINAISYVNGGTDSFDREIKRCLSKLKRRGMNSDCETSDDHGNNFSEEDDMSGGETIDTESSDDLRLRGEIEDVKGNGYLTVNDSSASIGDDCGWGARMTKASLVPPVTRKYEVIGSYLVIEDEEEVKRKMQAALPDDYPAKLFAQKSGIEESDMEIPEVKEYKPRKMLGVEVIEQEVYGIDPYTHNLLLDSMYEEPDWVLVDKHKFIEEVLLRSLNKQVRHFTGTGNSPMVYPLRPVVEEIQKKAEADGDTHTLILCRSILKAMQCRRDHNYVAYRKGLGVVCNKEEGFGKDDFVVDFLGEVYPAWKWFEKQDGIKSLQKDNQDPAPEFYNIYLERPKGDRDGYDLVVVDAMHKANYASRICHSCRPNCEAKVTAVDGQYQIGIYTVHPIGYGEEVTYDYNSITESKEEYEASVCLCGSQICRGSYLNLTGEGAFEKVMKECHGVLDRHKLLLEACEANFVSEEDYVDLGRAGLGTCLLAGLPDWLVAYSAHLVRFINFERSKLPEAILKHNLEEKKKFFADINFEVEESDAEVQAEGVYNTRLQNLALTLDRVKYVMRCVFGDPKKAPPPLEKLSSETLGSVLWKGEGSLVEELLQSMAPHMDPDLLSDLKSKIRAHNPSGSRELRKSLLWLRDELRDLPCNSKCRHGAAADMIHMYAFTKCFYKVREYKSFTSPCLYISPLDLGPKYIEKMGSGFQEYCKTYGKNYCLGQLIYWHTQTNADPDCRLARARRGCLSLPDVSSFYGKSHNQMHERVYDSRTFRFMLSRMERQPQRPWPTDGVWVFKNSPRFFGSPMLDVVLNRSTLDKEMMQWLKYRPTLYQSM